MQVGSAFNAPPGKVSDQTSKGDVAGTRAQQVIDSMRTARGQGTWGTVWVNPIAITFMHGMPSFTPVMTHVVRGAVGTQ